MSDEELIAEVEVIARTRALRTDPSSHSQRCPYWLNQRTNPDISDCNCWILRNDRRLVAEVVAGLSAAGRLLPPVVDSRREWRIVSTENTQLDEGFQFETVYQDEIETVDEAIAALREWREEYGRTDARMQFHDITHVSGGGIYYAPWCEVSP